MSEIKPHLLVVQHPNPTHRAFHVVREVYQGSFMHGFGKEDMLSNFEKNGLTDVSKELIKRLEAIPGLASGSIKQYEVSVCIGEAFSWKDVGPLVVGEIIKTIYPDVIDGTLEISCRIGWSYYAQPGGGRLNFGFGSEDDGFRTRYQDIVDHEPVTAKLGAGRPSLDIEHMLDGRALEQARLKAKQESSAEESEAAPQPE